MNAEINSGVPGGLRGMGKWWALDGGSLNPVKLEEIVYVFFSRQRAVPFINWLFQKVSDSSILFFFF